MAEIVNLDAELTTCPTVLIAAGGTGLDMVERIVKKQSEMYGDGSWKNPPKAKVVLIDTNVDELKTAKETLVNLGASVSTIELDFRTVDQALRRYQNNPAFMAILRSGGLVNRTRMVNGDVVISKENELEVDQNLVNDARRQILNIQGAAQNPAFSRMSFFSKFDQYATILEEAIQYVTADGYSGDAPRVMIFMSAFGGTGSGVALPVLYALRHRYPGDELLVDLYLFDGSFARDVSRDSSFERTAQLNTIRVERELDVVTCDSALNDPILPEPGGRNDGAFKNGNFKFTDVYLFSKQVFGGKGDNVSFAEAKESVAAAVVNRTFLQRAGKAKGFENHAYKKNRQDEAYVCSLSGMKRDYCSMASSSISFPFEEALQLVVENNLCRALDHVVNGGGSGIGSRELIVNFDAPSAYSVTAVNTLAREAVEELGKKLTAAAFEQLVPSSLPALASLDKNSYNQVKAAVDDCQKDIEQFVQNAISSALSCSGEQAKNCIIAAKNSISTVAKTIKERKVEAEKEAGQRKREADALADENLKKSKYRDEYTEQYRSYANANCKAEVLNKIFDLLRIANEKMEQAARDLDGNIDKVRRLVADVDARRRAMYAKMKDRIKDKDPKYDLVTEEWLQGLSEIKLDHANEIDLRVNERVVKSDRPAERMKEVRSDIAKALVGRIPNVVKRFVQMLDSDDKADNAFAKRRLQRTFELSSPHFAIREDGIERQAPISYCYCLVPWNDTVDAFSERFCDEIKELNFQQAEVGARDVVLVPSNVSKDIVFVQVLVGLRPNFAKEFPKMKSVYKNYGRNPGSWRITMTVEQNEWYNDEERQMYGSENINGTPRDPEDLNQL